MDDLTIQIWRQQRQDRMDERGLRRMAAPELLAKEGIPFVVKNGGAHIVVEGPTGFIDFWPGTAKWHTRDGLKGFGLGALVKLIKEDS